MRHFLARIDLVPTLSQPTGRRVVPTPKFLHRRGHIGNEENSEHAYCGIEAFIWEPEREQIAPLELRVAKTALRCFPLCQFQKPLSEIYAYDFSFKSDDFSS